MFYAFGLAFSRNTLLIAMSFIIAGHGNALYDPALNAYVLDIAPVQHQGRILGFKSTAGSLGSILGPALVVPFTTVLSAQGIFLIAMGAVFFVIVTFLCSQTKSQATQTTLGQSILDGNPDYIDLIGDLRVLCGNLF